MRAANSRPTSTISGVFLGAIIIAIFFMRFGDGTESIPESRMVNGKLVKLSDKNLNYPYVVCIVINNQHLYTGTLINGHLVLTAASSFEAYSGSGFVSVNSVLCYLDPQNKKFAKIEITKVEIHKKYKAKNPQGHVDSRYNIAIAVLEKNAPDIVNFVTLEYKSGKSKKDTSVLLTGFGAQWYDITNSKTKGPGSMLSIELTLQDFKKCTGKKELDEKHLLCVEDTSTNDLEEKKFASRNGDIGAPVFVTDQTTETISQIGFFIDTTDSKQGICIKVKHFQPWIATIMKKYISPLSSASNSNCVREENNYEILD